jgi:hypothetical protein
VLQSASYNFTLSPARYQPGTGHFTQMVWRASTQVGCAVSTRTCKEKTYVCQYGPPGNINTATAWRANVLRPSATPAAVPKETPPTAAVVSQDPSQALARHNMYRRRHGVPDLVWDASVAATAARWAQGCPNGHSGYSGVGENMAWGYNDFNAVVDAWYDEVSAAADRNLWVPCPQDMEACAFPCVLPHTHT